jgi:hypothetical protein
MALLSRSRTLGAVALFGGTLLLPPFQPYLVFIVMNGLVLANAVILYVNIINPDRRPVDDLLGIAVLALSQITVTQLYPGLAGQATLDTVIGMQVGCLGLTLLAVRLGWLRRPSWDGVRAAGVALGRAAWRAMSASRAAMAASVIACCAFTFVFAVSALNPPIGIDSLFFHLMRPVEWLQTGRIPVKLMPNYSYPHGIGLITLWLLFPFHHDFIARLSQTPFILLGCVASYGICRVMDMPRPLAFITALAVLTMPAYLANGIALTDPDTQMAGMFLVSLYFGLALARTYRRGTVILLALALGLLLSAKYNAVYYGVPLVALVAHAWIKGSPGTVPRRFIGHGALLVFLPLAIGGVTYLYDLYTAHTLYPFNIPSGPGPDRPRFSLSRFLLSPESLIDISLSGVIGLAAVFGAIRHLRHGRWQALVLPGFVALPLGFSLAIYVLYGYYEGYLAIRHLLGTLALCIILAGWTVAQTAPRGQAYGAWGLVGVAGLSGVLGFVRQWPVHRLPTDLVAACLALAAAAACWHLLRGAPAPRRIRALFASTPALLCMAWAGLWMLYAWEWAYRDLKYARWPPWFGFGTGWNHVARLTADRGARIAYNLGPYPLFGYDLQNTLIRHVPDFTRADTPEEQTRKLRAWEADLIRQRIDYVYLFAANVGNPNVFPENDRFDLLTAWMAARPHRYTPEFLSHRESLFTVRGEAYTPEGPHGD